MLQDQRNQSVGRPYALQGLLVSQIMLDMLREVRRGHLPDVQVLIFSQFKIMLNVLEDYLRLKQFPFERIDGSVSQRDRESAINRYSAGTPPSSSICLVLLEALARSFRC